MELTGQGNDLNNNKDDVLQSYALLRVSASHFNAMPERIEFNSTPCLSGYLTLHKDTIADLHVKIRSKPSNPLLSFSFRVDRQWRLQQIQDAGNSIELASVYAQNGPAYTQSTLSTLTKGINRIDCPLSLLLHALHGAQFSRMFTPALPTDCLTNLFIHGSDVVLSFYFIHATSKRAHPNVKRLYYPVGTVFEIGQQKMEVAAVHHGKAQIQWLKQSRDSALTAVSLLKDIV